MNALINDDLRIQIRERFKKIYLIFIFLLVNYSSILAQNESKKDEKTFPSISINLKNGAILQTNKFVRGDNLIGIPFYDFSSFSMKMLWQNPCYTDWQRLYKLPYYGFSISIGNFYNSQEVGRPISLYGNLGLPIVRWNKLELYIDLQFGIAFDWQSYNPITNPKNIAIGSHKTIHIGIGLIAFFQISKHFDLGAGLEFLHFSNGAVELPNSGINVCSPSLELKYHIRGRADRKGITFPERLEWSNDLFFMAGFGRYQLTSNIFTSEYHSAVGLSIIYYKQLANAFRLGVGSDIDYWTGIRALPDGSRGPQGIENFTFGIGIYPEMIIDRLSIVGGIGLYAYHFKFGDFKKLYQRLGIRYDFRNNISVGINIRSIDFSRAEFLEFNTGYRIRWINRNHKK